MRAPMAACCLPLLAAALAVDGGAASKHAAQLAALGPHPFGSPRSRFAAEYVAAQFREAGLAEVRLQEVEAQGATGANVIGVLRSSGPGFIVLAAHHDTPPDSPGASASGGGVGVLIEAARAWSRRSERTRTVVFASLDAREPRLAGRGGLGARAYVQSLGRTARDLAGALVLDRAGRRGAPVVLDTVAYADPLRPGGLLVAPEGLVSAAVLASRVEGVPVAVGDPRWSWLYQAGVRTFRTPEGGDDRPFLEAGLPALRLSAAAEAREPAAADTAERLDAAALGSAGRLLLGAAAVLQNSPRPPVADSDWFLGLGQLVGRNTLLLAGAASVLPGLLGAFRAGGAALALRGLQAVVFGLLLYRHPVVATWCFLPANLLIAFTRHRAALFVSALPLLLLVGLAAWLGARNALLGVHLAVFDLVLGGLAAALALSGARLIGARGARRRRSS
jgi:hypothetical protein